ncbi:uncharacterized protein LOC134227617 isoform X2 [Armigeres subalbatus]
MANIVLKLEPSEQQASEICSQLSSSERKYRHIIFQGYDDDCYVLPKIVERFKCNLESLFIKGCYESSLQLSIGYIKRLFDSLTMLKELRIQTMIDFEDDIADEKIVLPVMPHLRILYLEYDSLEASRFDWREIAPNLKHLYISHNLASSNFIDLMSFYGQQLTKLGITLEGEEYCSVGDENVKFPLVRHLSVKCWSKLGINPTERLFKSFTNLSELSLGHYLSSEQLSLIVKYHPSLLTLRLYDAMPENGLQMISKLPNLQRLYLFRITLNHDELAQTDCFHKVQQLSLKYVEVGDADVFFAKVCIKIPNIISLEIAEAEEKQISAACRHLCNLQQLTVLFENYMSSEMFRDISQLNRLTELKIYSHAHKLVFNWTWFSRCPNILILAMMTQFSPSGKDTEEWKAFADNFPSLTVFEIAKCKLQPIAIEYIQNRLPNCEIRPVSQKGPFEADTCDATLQFRNDV